jgi:monosaccharide-transporting ATPase
MAGKKIMTLRDIEKTFPGVKALDHAQLTLRKGEIHALMGENGAGKSTLIKCLTGVYERDSGEINMEGEKGNLFIHSTQEAQNKGIVTVYQEVNLCPNLTVAENLFIGREPKTKLGFIDWKAMIRMSKKIMSEHRFDIDVTKTLGDYSLAIQQLIAIARAVDIEAKVLILDEPTSSLDEKEVENLFALMRQLKKKDVAILFVTHFLEQVYAVADRITVLRNGAFVGEYKTAELPRIKLVAAMLGKDLDDLSSIKPEGESDIGEKVVVKAEGLSHSGKIKPFDFIINEGEVVGVTGLLGSGRSEMVRCIYGADRSQTGKLTFKGKRLKVRAPIDAIKAGMGYLPDDRKADGLISELTVRENIILALQARNGFFKMMPRDKQEKLADEFIELLQIKTASREAVVSQLSGGNQQKVILARWLCTKPDFLILDEPTRGIDVGTKTEFQKLILKFASEGVSIVFISSEIEEMLRTCSRMCVMRDGEKVSEISGLMTQESVMNAIAGGE